MVNSEGRVAPCEPQVVSTIHGEQSEPHHSLSYKSLNSILLITLMKRLVLSLMCMFSISAVFSQSAEEVLKLLVDKDMISQSDADELKKESESKKQPAAQLLNFVKNSEIFNLSGYGQVIYSVSDNALGNAYTNGQNNNMKVARAFLLANGKFKKVFGYQVLFDFSKATMHEYYGEYTPITSIGVRFGQYKVPFTIEGPTSPARWETIYSTRSVEQLAGESAGRDMGLQVSGKLLPIQDFHFVQYWAGFFNGTGMNTPDNNNHKDFAGTLLFQPIKGLRAGGSIYSGKRLIENVNHTRDRWSAGAEYDSHYVYLRSEYIWGNDAGLKREGCYGTAMYKIVPTKWEVVAKYDYYNADKNIDNSEINEFTGGVNYYFWPLSRIQLNYIHTDNKVTNQIYNTVAMQFQVFF